VNLYLDTEFDGHGGDLLSLALAGEDGKHWYGVWESGVSDVYRDPWVRENVLPRLGDISPGYGRGCLTTVMMRQPDKVMRVSLKEYLLSRSGCAIWADWPDDFAHLTRLMSGPTYAESFMIPCTMQLIVTPPGEPKPEIPHNALSDAIALMKWHQGVKEAAE
jgi:hypothetical protein